MTGKPQPKTYQALKAGGSIGSIFFWGVRSMVLLMVGPSPLFPWLVIIITLTYPMTAMTVPVISQILYIANEPEKGKRIWWLVVLHFLLFRLMAAISLATMDY